MKLSGKITEYGFLGAFFLVFQLVFMFILWPSNSWRLYSHLTNAIDSTIQSSGSIKSVFNATISATGFVSIFFVGLFIDLITIVSQFSSSRSFKIHADKNKAWLSIFLKKHESYIGIESKQFLDKYEYKSSYRKLLSVSKTLPFSSKYWSKYWKLTKENWKEWEYVKNYNKMYTFLIVYCVTNNSNATPNILVDELRIQRTIKGVSTVLWIISMEISVIIILEMYFLNSDFNPFRFFITLSSSYFFLGLSSLFIRKMDDRICETIFSTTYILSNMSAKETS